MKLPDSDLADIFSGKVKVQDSSDGKIFMDRNAEIFCVMLDYLRNSVKKTPFRYEFKMGKVQVDIDKWNIPLYQHVSSPWKSIYSRALNNLGASPTPGSNTQRESTSSNVTPGFSPTPGEPQNTSLRHSMGSSFMDTPGGPEDFGTRRSTSSLQDPQPQASSL